MRFVRRPSCRTLAAILAALAAPAAGQEASSRKAPPGNLLVAPTRVVFEGRTRTAELTLINTDSREATYRISFVNVRMGLDGSTREIDSPEPGEQLAQDLIRYSPRQVVLAPNVAQSVRLQVRKPADLAPGEYRSHLLFRAVPAEPDARSEPVPGAPAGGLSIDLVPIYGVSIPVIVRHGETKASVALSGLERIAPAVPGGRAALRFRIERSGNQSVYGNLTATFAADGGKPLVVGQANGVAVYVPNAARVFTLPLDPPPGSSLARGVVHLELVAREKVARLLAEADLRVP